MKKGGEVPLKTNSKTNLNKIEKLNVIIRDDLYRKNICDYIGI